MRIRDIFEYARDIPAGETLSLAALTLSLRKEEILTRGDREMDSAALERLEGLLGERRKGKPLAYITGEKEFFSLPFLVDERVLIPRPETELLVEEALRVLRLRPHGAAILDMGTGSGAVGVTVAKMGGVGVICVDNSQPALVVARENARRLGVRKETRFVCSDLFRGLREGLCFDLILANLPYVSESLWPKLDRDVREFEPAGALIGGEDGLDVYRRFAGQVKGRVASGGVIICEIDGPGQAESLSAILNAQGFSVASKRDYSDRERIVIGHG